MLEFSSPLKPRQMQRGDVFFARQYSRLLAPDLFDPVLNVDWFDMRGPTFPAHPHAGFSAITYLFADSPGGFMNRDSLGNALYLPPGSMHVSRASRGIIHEEVPAHERLPVRGLQIFINLPAARQLDEAGAFHVASRDMCRPDSAAGERIAVDGTRLGEAGNALPSPITIRELTVEPTYKVPLKLRAGWGGIAIALQGGGALGERRFEETEAIAFRNVEDQIWDVEIGAGLNGLRVAIIAGAQLRQPVHEAGSMMLADPAELELCAAAYRRGEFGTLPPHDASSQR